ncbi:hypothetical protein ABFS82_05G032300 [Erythranthe guttata]|uniref:Uncharacterized protein n=1 Tax=Erythranthe guttata TaxID=4155 RepID=A0A022QPW9_ERYGU|nr:hypothetical protein MIMGU_mgv1a016637mg [Erythranthe guttata]
MELEKRKRKCDGGEAAAAEGKRGKKLRKGEEHADAVKEAVTPPEDEEVEEFFAILKRIHVAVKYFQKRNGGRDLTVTDWCPSFKTEDFDGANKVSEKIEGKGDTGLDLNSEPI